MRNEEIINESIVFMLYYIIYFRHNLQCCILNYETELIKKFLKKEFKFKY
jgi:hypothetical protein